MCTCIYISSLFLYLASYAGLIAGIVVLGTVLVITVLIISIMYLKKKSTSLNKEVTTDYFAYQAVNGEVTVNPCDVTDQSNINTLHKCDNHHKCKVVVEHDTIYGTISQDNVSSAEMIRFETSASMKSSADRDEVTPELKEIKDNSCFVSTEEMVRIETSP